MMVPSVVLLDGSYLKIIIIDVRKHYIRRRFMSKCSNERGNTRCITKKILDCQLFIFFTHTHILIYLKAAK
jgi:hypothetical protein